MVSINLSIKGVPDELAERLRIRAERNHRSLQGELMAIIERAALEVPPEALQAERDLTGSMGQAARSLVPRRQGWKSVAELMAERHATGWRAPRDSAGIPLAVDIIRADRDSR